MHFITGGAFNGKRKWVKSFYKLNEKNDYVWISAYEKNEIDWNEVSSFHTLTIMEGIEQFLYEWAIEPNWKLKWDQLLENGIAWERTNPKRTLVIIGTDMTKGIVPLDKRKRSWRDITGWCYQDLVKKSNRVDLIWYGINERIK